MHNRKRMSALLASEIAFGGQPLRAIAERIAVNTAGRERINGTLSPRYG